MTKIIVFGAFDLPQINKRRNVWQPVTDKNGLKMRLAPLDWQPSGAHHALEYQAAEIDRLTGENEALKARVAELGEWKSLKQGK